LFLYRNENNDRKQNLNDVNEWIRTENEKRMAEAEALRAKYVKSQFLNKTQIRPHPARVARESPLPESPIPESPIPESPLPESPLPESPLPESPLPQLPLPQLPLPESALRIQKLPLQKLARPSRTAYYNANIAKRDQVVAAPSRV
jgi:hypothetical protein